MTIRSKVLTVTAALVATIAVLIVLLSFARSSTRVDETGASFTASNGLTSEYDVYADGLPRKSPLCAVFVFHGDGAYEFLHPTSTYSLGGSTGIIAKAHKRGCLTVPVLSPDSSGTVTWWQNGAANARYFRELLSKLKTDYNIDPGRIWLVGYSGGAQFITQFYLPLYSSQINSGGAVMFGGGGPPYAVDPQMYASSLTATFHMFWYTGEDDNGSTSWDGYNALRDAKRGEAFYAAQGFRTSHEYPPNTAHDLDGRFGGILDQQLSRWDTSAFTSLHKVTNSSTVPRRTVRVTR